MSQSSSREGSGRLRLHSHDSLTTRSVGGLSLELSPPLLHPTALSSSNSVLQRSREREMLIWPRKREVIFCNLILCNQIYAF